MVGDVDRSSNSIYLQLHTIGSKIYNKTSINPVKKNTTSTSTLDGGSWPLVVIMRDCSNTVDNCGFIGLSEKAKRLSLSRSSFLLASASKSPSLSSYYYHHHHHHILWPLSPQPSHSPPCKYLASACGRLIGHGEIENFNVIIILMIAVIIIIISVIIILHVNTPQV